MKKRMGKLFQVIISAAVLLLMLGWIAGVFHSKVRPEDETSLATADQETHSITVERTIVPSYYEALGTVHSRTEVTISARVPGTIREILVEEGDAVRRNQLLVTLDAPELSAATYSAVGQVDAAQSALSQARRDFERYEELYNRGIVSRQQYEQMKTAVEVAEGNLSAARGGANQAGSVAAYTRIESPAPGVVALKYLEEGDVVGPGTPILLVHDPESLRLEAAVDESVAQSLSVGETVVVRVDAADLVYPTVIEEIVPQVDRATRTVVIKALLPPESRLRPGLFGRLEVPIGDRSGIFIPQTAVRTIGALETVQIIKDGRRVTRYVRLGEREGDRVEVLTGLQQGDQLVVPSSTRENGE